MWGGATSGRLVGRAPQDGQAAAPAEASPPEARVTCLECRRPLFLGDEQAHGLCEPCRSRPLRRFLELWALGAIAEYRWRPPRRREAA